MKHEGIQNMLNILEIYPGLIIDHDGAFIRIVQKNKSKALVKINKPTGGYMTLMTLLELNYFLDLKYDRIEWRKTNE